MKLLLILTLSTIASASFAQMRLPTYDEANKISLSEISDYKEALRGEFLRLSIHNGSCKKNGVQLEYFVDKSERDSDANWYLSDAQPLIIYYGLTNSYGNLKHPIEIKFYTDDSFTKIKKIVSSVYYLQNGTRVNTGTLKNPVFSDDYVVKTIAEDVCYQSK
ncbi:MAG: hypothetical protein JNM93_06235 [Bacteriovoracaceae bacterium]|nr:hypothetical protein [Bacteriovoracaceae bacterium]